MKLRKLTPSDYFLILVNLIPVYAVWFEGWNAAQVFIVYCLETVIIGIFNVLKMACVTIFNKPNAGWQNFSGNSNAGGLFLIVFFIFHYGFFVFVQTQIFFGISGIIHDDSVFGVYRQIPQALGRDGQLLLLIFIVYYTLETLYDFFLTGQYKTIAMAKLMFQPYGRIFIQQFVVIVGSMFLLFGGGNVFILILAAVKIAFELFVNINQMMDRSIAEAAAKKELQDKA